MDDINGAMPRLQKVYFEQADTIAGLVRQILPYVAANVDPVEELTDMSKYKGYGVTSFNAADLLHFNGASALAEYVGRIQNNASNGAIPSISKGDIRDAMVMNINGFEPDYEDF